MVSLVFLLILPLHSLACNTEEDIAADIEFSHAHDGQGGLPVKQWLDANGKPKLGGVANLTLLPQDAGNESPACLDGSPYGFYFIPSTTGSKRWTVSISGGGWCYNETLCYARSKTGLGSSKYFRPTAGCNCMNVLENGTLDENCNCLYMPYGDGASFSGYRADPWPVASAPGEHLYFRGIKNFDATMDYLFANGLKDAEEFVLTGGSAGGLSTFLHADRIAARLQQEAPNIKRVTAAPVVGYFLDHGDYAHDDQNYTAWMHYIYNMQNLTFGTDGGLTEACHAKHADAPWLCFMSPHMQDVINTPFFMFNSKYDAWQLGNELRTPDRDWKEPAEQKAVLDYGMDFLEQFKPVTMENKNGAMITSCICHGCSWDTLEVNGKTSYQHYADWFFGKTSGIDNFHVDPSEPNGNGTFTDPRCSKFPKQ